MDEHVFRGHQERDVVIDICFACQSFWFDQRESLALTPASTLALFRLIGDRAGRPQRSPADLAKCPRCRGRLRLTKDLQRATRFEYLRCPHDHGRLISFVDFLKEKHFIRALSAQQVADLRDAVGAVNCSNCGAPVDLHTRSTCAHCGSALTMLDLKQAEALIAQLQAADRTGQPVDPALPLALERARRETEANFAVLMRDSIFTQDLTSGSLVAAGLHAVARWLK
ncbi:MAG: hypothetical protein IT178_06315 [Acidobacteria bacterium]|nr:hypothetical protein [Acidobacteriota bacterium]